MSDDQKPPMPPQPVTRTLPAVSVPSNTLDAVLSEVRAARSDMHDLKGTVDLLAEQGVATAKWRSDMEQWRSDVDAAITRNSSRVRGVSDNDMAQEAKLAEVIVWRQNVTAELATTKADAKEAKDIATRVESKTDAQTKILTTLESNALRLVKHPLVQAFLIALITFVTAWLVKHT